jgi:hypothetical protein
MDDADAVNDLPPPRRWVRVLVAVLFALIAFATVAVGGMLALFWSTPRFD